MSEPVFDVFGQVSVLGNPDYAMIQHLTEYVICGIQLLDPDINVRETFSI
jgi:hypothetical protein